MRWWLKAITQKTISFLPGKFRINAFFQKYVTKGLRLTDAFFEDRLRHAANHWHAWEKYGAGGPPQRVLELGSGWYPVVPLSLFLAGAGEIITTDLHNHFKLSRIRETVLKLVQYIRTDRFPLPVIPERLETLKQWLALPDSGLSAFYRETCIRQLTGSSGRLPVEDNSVHLITSNNTLEHIYPDDLYAIFREFSRLISPQGIMSHFIDMTDHYAHLDPRITVLHFLKYSPRAWRWIDNSIQPMNRWRLPDYRALIRGSGFKILDEAVQRAPEEILEKTPVHASFQRIPADEILATYVHFAAVSNHD